jgi:hypothetical protein
MGPSPQQCSAPRSRTCTAYTSGAPAGRGRKAVGEMWELISSTSAMGALAKRRWCASISLRPAGAGDRVAFFLATRSSMNAKISSMCTIATNLPAAGSNTGTLRKVVGGGWSAVAADPHTHACERTRTADRSPDIPPPSPTATHLSTLLSVILVMHPSTVSRTSTLMMSPLPAARPPATSATVECFRNRSTPAFMRWLGCVATGTTPPAPPAATAAAAAALVGTAVRVNADSPTAPPAPPNAMGWKSGDAPT